MVWAAGLRLEVYYSSERILSRQQYWGWPEMVDCGTVLYSGGGYFLK